MRDEGPGTVPAGPAGYGAAGPDGEPEGEEAEYHFPGRVGQGAQTTDQHPGHGHPVGHVGDVGVAVQRPLPDPGRQQTGQAVQRGDHHQSGQDVDEPTGLHGLAPARIE